MRSCLFAKTRPFFVISLLITSVWTGRVGSARATELQADSLISRIVSSLGANESATLPQANTAGDLNDEAIKYGLDRRGPGKRDYCIKMVWMPDRGRAVYYGANHGVPHRLNDVWEYDLASNTWNCLYGPDVSKGNKADWKDVDWELAKSGIIRTQRGGPAIVPHSWWNVTYDPQRRAMLTFCSWSMANPELLRLLTKGKHHPPLWAFYPDGGKWEPIFDSSFEGPRPNYENARSLEYIPELGGTLWTQSGGLWLYDSGANRWKQLGKAADYGDALPAREQVTCYAPDRKLLVAHDARGKGGSTETGFPASQTAHYDVVANTWTVAIRSDELNHPPAGFDARTNFVYDTVAKRCLLWDPHWTKSLWSYDPGTTRWEKLSPSGPPPPTDRDSALAYYDAAHGVFVIPGKWVYRSPRASP